MHESIITIILSVTSVCIASVGTWAMKRFLDTIPKTQDVLELKKTLDRLCQSIDDVSKTIAQDLENVQDDLSRVRDHIHIHDKKIAVLEAKYYQNGVE